MVTIDVNDLFVWPIVWRYGTAGGARAGGLHGHDLDRGRWEPDLCRRRRSVARRRGVSGGQPEKLLAGRGHAGSLPRRPGAWPSPREAPTTSTSGRWVSRCRPGPQVRRRNCSRRAGPTGMRPSRPMAVGWPSLRPFGNVGGLDQRRRRLQSCGADGIWRTPTTGSPEWSPDGRFIAFDSRVEGLQYSTWSASEGGQPRRVDTGVAQLPTRMVDRREMALFRRPG